MTELQPEIVEFPPENGSNGGAAVSGLPAVTTAGSCHSVTLVPREDLVPPPPQRKRKLSQEEEAAGVEEAESQVSEILSVLRLKLQCTELLR